MSEFWNGYLLGVVVMGVIDLIFNIFRGFRELKE